MSSARPSGSSDARSPPGPAPPKPSPGNDAAGSAGKPGIASDVVGSRPANGVPCGSENRTVSWYSYSRFCPEEYPSVGVKVSENLWIRGWYAVVPSVFLWDDQLLVPSQRNRAG